MKFHEAIFRGLPRESRDSIAARYIPLMLCSDFNFGRTIDCKLFCERNMLQSKPTLFSCGDQAGSIKPDREVIWQVDDFHRKYRVSPKISRQVQNIIRLSFNFDQFFADPSTFAAPWIPGRQT
jgi:hypothetical protein